MERGKIKDYQTIYIMWILHESLPSTKKPLPLHIAPQSPASST